MGEYNIIDYIYVRYLEDVPNYKKGDIIRIDRTTALREICSNVGLRVLDNFANLDLRDTEDAEDKVFYDEAYSKIVIKTDCTMNVWLSPGKYLYLGKWFNEHLDQESREILKKASLKPADDCGARKYRLRKEDSPDKLVKVEKVLSYPCELTIHLKEGEVLDFALPDVKVLFYDSERLDRKEKEEILTGEEKKELFKEDFSNAIVARTLRSAQYPGDTKEVLHYFKVKPNFQISCSDELYKNIKITSGDYEFVRYNDSDYIISIDSQYGSWYDRPAEEALLEVADRVDKEEAKKIHEIAFNAARAQYEKEEKEWKARRKAAREAEEKAYSAEKGNPLKFPGTQGEFIQIAPNQKKKQYTLEQIKSFYAQLKKLDPEILEQMCLYGGTVPYILTDAESSRDFGDVDIFIPMEYIERLRSEFSKDPSFEMHCDSLKYTKATGLVSDIRPIKPQDFGFKGSLFGINVSVFPVYNYGSNLMAKSFNITDKYKYLLATKVLNKAELKDVVRKVKINGAVFNVFSLEYTLVSKESGKREKKRAAKDTMDIEYIQKYAEELGLDTGLLEKIKERYPEYPISIAYGIGEDGKSYKKISGEQYKQLILREEGVSIHSS